MLSHYLFMIYKNDQAKGTLAKWSNQKEELLQRLKQSSKEEAKIKDLRQNIMKISSQEEISCLLEDPCLLHTSRRNL